MSDTPHLVHMFDSTIVLAHVSAADEHGVRLIGAGSLVWRLLGQNPRNAGGDGDPLGFCLAGGEVGDRPYFEIQLDSG
ncbi:hypothetical protein JKG68_20275 [Microvirga aerilata]|uniref:Uncharacterized protein n=2 Tax=Microvirga aerilata TaxID=670292 RepID=A0A936ZKH3_9HYPH|nr:hypothetical protein [Microvirga aerilata]